LQQGITGNQLAEMHTAGVSLVVPEVLHKSFPQGHSIKLLTVEGFIQTVKHQLNV
jgi:hypothetical protein